MFQSKIRKYHKYCGIIFSPFFIITAITGFMLVLSNANIVIMSPNVFQFMFNLHTWSFLGKIIGLLFAIMLLFMVTSGLILFISVELKKRKATK